MKKEHGDKGECPSCRAPGTFDLKPGHIPEFEDWIAVNRQDGQPYWECWDCWLK